MLMAKRNFKGKVVVITGAYGGLGSALCRAFGEKGALVVATDINEEGIHELCQQLKNKIDIIGYRNDVTDEENVNDVVAKILKKYQRIDVLINNAGISHLSSFKNTSSKVMRRIININLFGALHWTAAVLPSLITNKGMIICLSSVTGYAPLYARSMYCASKHALHGCFETIRVEEKNVDVMMVCPSFIKTKINEHAIAGDGGPAQKNRASVGKQMTADYAALSILKAARARKKLLLLGRISKLSYMANKISKNLYAYIMKRNFSSEVEK